MKKRICELLTGDVFLIWGVWRKVSKIENGRLYFCWLNEQKCRESFGARSQQFVIVPIDNLSQGSGYEVGGTTTNLSLTIKQRNTNAA